MVGGSSGGCSDGGGGGGGGLDGERLFKGAASRFSMECIILSLADNGNETVR